MSTRKLILTALLCGLAILVAGGVMLFRLSTTETVNDAALAEGTTATVNGITVGVLSHSVDGTTLRLTVKAASETGWGVITDTGTPVPRSAAACAEGECRLDFDFGKISRVPKSFLAGFSSGSQKASWALDNG